MDGAKYEQVTRSLIDESKMIEGKKRPAYTVGDVDVLKNFKAVADRAGIKPMQAWLIYFLKHVDSITAYAKDPTIPQAETMRGRFADAINYLKLGYALAMDVGSPNLHDDQSSTNMKEQESPFALPSPGIRSDIKFTRVKQ